LHNTLIDRHKMSQHSEDNFMSACSDSFWEPGNYKRTTKRIEDGNKLCGDLMSLVTERAEIEKSYSKQLKAWAAKWNNLIEKGPEYGTMEAAWKAVLVESDRRCDLHNRVRDDLQTKANNELKMWQKETYHKSMMQLKEKKEMDDAFKKAQKPWAKLLSKVNKCKSDYHNACKNEKSAINMERNAAGDSSVSEDHILEMLAQSPAFLCVQKDDKMRKLRDRVSKSKDQVSRCRDNYENALHDLNNYNAKYMEDMTDVFERCQRMEAQRLQRFKEVLFTVQKCLNISEDPVLPQIYEEFYHTVNNADHDKDLRLWSNTHGINMAMNWPQFEEYTEEFRDIAAGKVKKGPSVVGGEGNITLLHQRPVGDDLPENPSSGSRQNGGGSGGGSSRRDPRNGTSSKNSSGGGGATTTEDRLGRTGNNTTHSNPPYRSEMSNGGLSSTSNNERHFEEEEWDDNGGGAGGGDHVDPLVDNGEPGVRVRALYDYEAAESDELDFKAGDTFEKLEDEDEQGWCKGRKDGKVGLYPANYIEVI